MQQMVLGAFQGVSERSEWYRGQFRGLRGVSVGPQRIQGVSVIHKVHWHPILLVSKFSQ